ncbi:MAG: 2-succinyl-5-enolpyruvyl-6-hydroxy-3-cyclohexene-1-carboxylic-acid synthase [Actinomycetota bacterium]|nr:2-succinyl-5-enolpyruvyl-6-hydroxy-3-cyclohexene-1-carboxylic-acid synthase [Actinomycetota bacterium]
MIPINRTFAPVQALVDELARCGMRHAVTSPGSRNAPIALTLAADERIDAVSAIDERAAGFMALGMAKASGLPVAVTCTSGTAAANLLPAVVEAWQAHVPLIVLTADRPPELRDVGAGQAIDQVKLFGSAAKWFVEVGNGDPGREWATHVRALACRAWWTASGGRAGPVHLNMALREPLAPVAEELEAEEWQGRENGRPWVELREHSSAPDGGDVQVLAERAAATPRGAIVCGGGAEAVDGGIATGGGAHSTGEPSGALAAAVTRLARESGWPILAEPTSGLRCGEHDRSHVVAHYDVLLRDEAFAERQRPELVLRIGDMPTSKPLRAWLSGTAQVVIDPDAVWNEPTRTAETLLHADPARTCDALAAAIEARGTSADSGWVGRWRAADEVVSRAFAEAPERFEAKAYAGIEGALPDDALVWVSSSMPIRYVESYFPSSRKPLRFLSNRGANGIDGVVASAAGAARASGRPTFVLIGEIALLHDVGGVLAARRAGIELTIVCVNNGGGGIFDFLPVAEHSDAVAYERHIATPAHVDLAALAALAGMAHQLVTTPAELASAIAAGRRLIEVRADRAESVEWSRALTAKVAGRLSE